MRCGTTVLLQYPTTLFKDIFKATIRQIRNDRDAQGMCSYDAGPIPDEDDRLFMKKQEELIGEYWDDVNGGWLDSEKVKQARRSGRSVGPADIVLRHKAFMSLTCLSLNVFCFRDSLDRRFQ